MPRSARLDVSNVLQHVTHTRDNLKGFWVKCVKEWGGAGADFEYIPRSEGKPDAPCVLSPGP